MLLLNDVDIADLIQLHDNSFPLPDVANPLYICKKTVVEKGKVIGIGLVRVTSEAILILDKEQPKVTRAVAVAMLKEEMSKEAKSKGLEDCHIFIKDSKFAAFMKRLGFKFDKGGQPLVLQL